MNNQVNPTSFPVPCRPDSTVKFSAAVPRTVALRPLAVALRRVLGGGLLAAGLMGPALGQSLGTVLSPAQVPNQSKSLDLSTLDGSNGFTLNGIAVGDRSGWSVSGAGDVNGDGIDDFLIGAPYADPNGAGQSYVVFGTNGGFPAALDLSALDGSNGFMINGIAAGDSSGSSVSGAGDVNGDGIDDLVIGAPWADPGGRDNAGQSYVVFGNSAGLPATVELSALNGSNGFALNGIAVDDRSGWSVSGAGDVNGDGVDDIILGAPNADLNSVDRAGQSYVVFGTNGGFPAALELSALDGGNGFMINGIAVDDHSGRSVSGAEDVNGDGVDDIILGAPGTSWSYVVFGTSTGFPAVLELSDLDGDNGFVLNGIEVYDFSVLSVSGAGDVNGDGIDDIVIGQAGFSGYSGLSYVVFGTNAGFPAAVDLSALDGSNGFVLGSTLTGSRTGFSVSGAGDVNGDGFDDLLVGAPGTYPFEGDSLGYSYVVFGASTFPSAILLPYDLDGSNGFIINGTELGDRLGHSVGGVGDVNGDGVDDIILGAPSASPNGENSGQSYVVFGTPSVGGPAVLLKGLIAEVEALDLPAGLEHWLARPLKRAEKKLDEGEVAKALYKVVGFIQRARVLRQYGILPADEANALIAQAKTIIKALLDLPELSRVAATDLLPADLIPSDGPVPAGPPATTQ
ncbi:integrin alpha [Nitrosococcus watsonii]|uniref:FG-GAP repeat protein n=1 Tax=Nitrosococcus watsoni (strain C-113) TaxID=105559 RepID=D8K4V9_NITWC|nr:integrin alpha [Nitrosococcus watsonii]ADJ27936.1 FG-GAP repeat protein [Nitrosococcus watsonii C-113]